MKKARKKVI